jgi:hypothetical protein
MRRRVVGLIVCLAATNAWAQDGGQAPSGNPCQGVSCGGHGTCAVQPTGPLCNCVDGYVSAGASGLDCVPGKPPIVASAAPPAPVAPPAPALGPAPGPQGWPYAFTAEESATLRAVGARFDPSERSVAEQMQKRGFTSQDYTRAFVDWRHSGSARVGEIQDIATFQYLGFSQGDYDRYRSSYAGESGNVTDYHNSRIGGQGLKIAGGILLALGLVDAIGGIVFLTQKQGLADAYPDNSLGSDPDYWHVGGLICIATGAVMAVVGLPLLAVGASRTARWAPEGSLDRGPVEQLKEYRGRKEADNVSLSVRPLVIRDAKGIGLNLQF